MSEKSPSKCSDCKRVFGSGYQDSLIDKTVQRCDEFEWCWDCDDKHTEQEIRNQTLAQVESIIKTVACITCRTQLMLEIKNLGVKHE